MQVENLLKFKKLPHRNNLFIAVILLLGIILNNIVLVTHKHSFVIVFLIRRIVLLILFVFKPGSYI